MADTFYRTLGATIAELRRAKGFTQKSLARQTRVGGAYIARIEAGNRKPTLDVLRAICAALDVDLWQLVQQTQSPELHHRTQASRRLTELLPSLSPTDAQLLVTLATRLRRHRYR
jgi:transcriptional regulator with XRE-family HTH domain